MSAFLAALDEIADRRVILFGGKGGVGKTTLSRIATEHLGATLVRAETLDADALYRRFLDENLESFLEIGDRGTYLDREELRRLFELALPGVDELMTWMHIGELAESSSSPIVVDTAPTGHTLRMLSSSEHFHQLALALDSMAEKHRALVQQFTRRVVRDAVDAFIEEFDARAARRRALLETGAFIPIMLSEPLVVEQTERLIAEVGMPVPFVVLNRAVLDPDCALDEVRVARDQAARARFPRVVDYPRACSPIWTARARWRCSSPPRTPETNTSSSPSILLTPCATSSRTSRLHPTSPSRPSTRRPSGAAFATPSDGRSRVPSMRSRRGGCPSPMTPRPCAT